MRKPDNFCRCSLLDWLVLEWRLMPRNFWKIWFMLFFSYTFIAPTQQSPISCQQKTLSFSREAYQSQRGAWSYGRYTKSVVKWDGHGPGCVSYFCRVTAGKPTKQTEFDMWGGHYLEPSRLIYLIWFLGTGRKVTRFLMNWSIFPLVWRWWEGGADFPLVFVSFCLGVSFS